MIFDPIDVLNDTESKKEMTILGHKGDVHVVLCSNGQDSFYGFMFYCEFCDCVHLHGPREGHRDAQCTNKSSPFLVDGYILTTNKDYPVDERRLEND